MSQLASTNIINIHQIGMTFNWCILFNVSVFMSLYKYRTYGHYVHAIIGITITLGTIGFLLPFLITVGFNV
jgi:hypothetical protein